MLTKILDEAKAEDLALAGKILREGGLVVIPTETVYGLAADASDPIAIRRIFDAKGRPSDNPLIVHISSLDQLEPLVSEIPDEAIWLAQRFWPGPLTLVLPKSELVSDELSGGLDTVAVRFPSNSTALAVIEAAGRPLAAPSANTSGRPSPTSFSHVLEDMNGKVDAIISGTESEVGVESTVLTLTGLPDKPAKILRPGGVTRAMLEEVLGVVELDPSILLNTVEEAPASPGMKYKHYAPKAQVVVVDASPEEYIRYVNDKQDSFALCFDEDSPELSVPFVSYGTRYDGALQARKLFEALHELDRRGAKKVHARIPSKNGVGLAVYNRLIRSAGFNTVNPYGHYIIGLTGPSGSGKTTVAKELEKLGCGVVDCDAITREPGVYDDECIRELQAAFGDDIAENGSLNRGLLAKRAFSSDHGKQLLNQITHPRILKRVIERIDQELEAGHKLVILDAPTLFESGIDSYCARIMVVNTNFELRLKRIMNRDGISQEQAITRLSAQNPNQFYLSRADHIVSGEGNYNLSKRLKPIVSGLMTKCH